MIILEFKIDNVYNDKQLIKQLIKQSNVFVSVTFTGVETLESSRSCQCRGYYFLSMISKAMDKFTVNV